MNKWAAKFFHDKEILSVENFYKFICKKKIIVFVPYDHVENLTQKMARAGAGLIGNYEICSFRTEGTGTFKPNKKAKPFFGKKNNLSYEKEIKLEMEFEPGIANKVIDALLKNHPYDETAYEIHDFKKRDKEPSGIIVTLNHKMEFRKLFIRLNKKIKWEQTYFKNTINKIIVTKFKVDETIIASGKFTDCDSILSISKTNFKLFKI